MNDEKLDSLCDAIYEHVTGNKFTGRKLLSRIIEEWVKSQTPKEQQLLYQSFCDDDGEEA